MKHSIQSIIEQIGEEFKNDIHRDARNYREINIGRKAELLGEKELGAEFRNVNAVIPLKGPVDGMKVRIDGRTFVDYAQFDSGVVVPGFVARKAGMNYSTYVPLDSMILNFT